MTDAAIISAFDRGTRAAKNDKPRADNPYAPESQEEQWEAWDMGWWWIEGPRYAIVRKKAAWPQLPSET